MSCQALVLADDLLRGDEGCSRPAEVQGIGASGKGYKFLSLT